MTLYAQWEPILKVLPIADITYTGSAIKPTVTITDNGKKLIQGKDYTVTYKNNVKVNLTSKVKDGMGTNFDENLPYVVVTGKGNYAGSIYINFNILPFRIGDDMGNPAKKITLNVVENCTRNKNVSQQVFKSIKSTVGMKEGNDFTVLLKAISVKDAEGKNVVAGTVLKENKIPAGYTGIFQLSITGIGNYSGKIVKTVYVQDKQYLISSATIKIGKNLKTTTYTGSPIELVPGYYDTSKKKYFFIKNNSLSTVEASVNDIFTVCCGKNYLIAGKDFKVDYEENTAVGTAKMTVIGTGEYSGTKSVTYKIVGAQFNSNKVTVSGIVDKEYIGKEVKQDDVKLYYSIGNGCVKELSNGKDYTIGYVNNINKGTATIKFTGIASAGFTGSFTKTFKINTVDISNTEKVVRSSSMTNISIGYAKGGAKPANQIELTNISGVRLVEGKDYKITYKNNSKLASATDLNSPIMSIQGIGNYTGRITVPFSIVPKDINSSDITVSISQIQYNPKAKESYIYKPVIKVTDLGTNMVLNVDYTVEFKKNTQADYVEYRKKVANDTARLEDCPRVIIRAKTGSNYSGTDGLVMEIPIYPTKMTASNIKVLISEMTYSGGQLKPKVQVYFVDNSKIMQRAKNITEEKELLALGFVKLEENSDYRIEYGVNIMSGKNKGKVTILGSGKTFGGKVVGTFSINAKQLEIFQ